MLYRRRILQALALTAAPAAQSAPLVRPPALEAGPVGASAIRLLQPVDASADQQELVRDHAAGVQLAVQTANRSGGVGGRIVQVQTLPVERSAVGLQRLQQRLRDDAGLLGLVGCAGESLSLAVVEALSRTDPDLAHVAPWLPDPRFDALPQVANLFASRDDQVRHALSALDAMGLREIGLVYDSAATRSTVQASLDASLRGLSLRPPSWTADEVTGVEGLVARLPASLPPVLAFAGGTLELARFVIALSARGQGRYVVSLSDADLGLLTQLGATRSLPLVLTQVVPNPRNTAVPLSRLFGQLHAQLYDDAPTPAGLAGYLSGRYLLQLLRALGPTPSRRALASEVQRRPDADIEGFRLQFGGPRQRGSRYVTQIMITRDGRLIG